MIKSGEIPENFDYKNGSEHLELLLKKFGMLKKREDIRHIQSKCYYFQNRKQVKTEEIREAVQLPEIELPSVEYHSPNNVEDVDPLLLPASTTGLEGGVGNEIFSSSIHENYQAEQIIQVFSAF